MEKDGAKQKPVNRKNPPQVRQVGPKSSMAKREKETSWPRMKLVQGPKSLTHSNS